MIHGRNLIVSLDGVAIAGAKSCDISIDQDFIKACSPTESRTFDKIPTTYDWGVSVGCLIPSSNLSVALTNKLLAGTKCFLTFTDGSGQNRAGWMYVKSCKESGNIGSLATFSASFESTGKLYKYTLCVPDQFTEGNICTIGISPTGVTYTIGSGASSTDGVQITAASAGLLVIFANWNWALLGTTFADVKQMIDYQETQRLEEGTAAYGDEDKVLPINGGTYTFLIDGHATQRKVFVLQQ